MMDSKLTEKGSVFGSVAANTVILAAGITWLRDQTKILELAERAYETIGTVAA